MKLEFWWIIDNMWCNENISLARENVNIFFWIGVKRNFHQHMFTLVFLLSSRSKNFHHHHRAGKMRNVFRISFFYNDFFNFTQIGKNKMTIVNAWRKSSTQFPLSPISQHFNCFSDAKIEYESSIMGIFCMKNFPFGGNEENGRRLNAITEVNWKFLWRWKSCSERRKSE